MPFVNTQTTTLAIRGTPDTHNWRGLFIAGPSVASGHPSLVMAAPPAEAISLLVGRTFYGSGTADLVINGSLGPGVGGSDYQGYATLAISRSIENGQTNTFGLFLDAPTVASGVNTTTLAIPDTLIPIHSGIATIFVSGGTTSAAGADNNNIGLIVKSNTIDNANATLYIDKDFNLSSNTTLHIRSGNSSGNITLATSGTLADNANIPLLIRTPVTFNHSLFTQGYIE
jgi:hypothetical protein